MFRACFVGKIVSGLYIGSVFAAVDVRDIGLVPPFDSSDVGLRPGYDLPFHEGVQTRNGITIQQRVEAAAATILFKSTWMNVPRLPARSIEPSDS